MSFFSKLFDKKVCDICGGEIGLFGNRKLEDGNCCKNCAAKLSPFFSDRRDSTVEEIKEQLAYREANKLEVAKFKITRELGEDTRVYIDENAGKFMVSSARDLKEANPDVIDLSQVTGCEIDIDEDKDEVKKEVKNADGEIEKVSYNPERYNYSYKFSITINVNHPYFDDIEFELTDDYIQVEASGNPNNSPFGFNSFSTGRNSRYGLEGSIYPPTLEDRRNNLEYVKYEEMGKEIKEALLNPRVLDEKTSEPDFEKGPEEEAAKANTAFCPWCGSKLTNAGAFCPNCGGKLNSEN